MMLTPLQSVVHATEEFRQSIIEKDTHRLAALHREDCAVFRAGIPPFQGRSIIIDGYEQAWKDIDVDMKIESQHMVDMQSSVVDYGVIHLNGSRSRYMAAWHQQSDGRWQLTCQMISADA